jgi:hypothetical protein
MTRIVFLKEEIARIDYETQRRARLLALQLQLCAIQASDDEIAERQRRLKQMEKRTRNYG